MRFKQASQVRDVVEQMREVDIAAHSFNRAKIAALFEGFPPFTEEEAEQEHVGRNVNFLEAPGGSLGKTGNFVSPAFGFNVFGIHTEKIACKNTGFIASGAVIEHVKAGRLDKAISTELKLAMGPAWRSVDIEGVIRHFRQTDVGLVEQVGSFMSTHPDMNARIDRIVDFYFSDLYHAVADAAEGRA